METKQALERKLSEIIRKYERTDDFLISTAYGDGGLGPLFPRLERAVLNQIDGGDATLNRYAIWANTVRDNLIEVIKVIEREPDKAIRHLKIAVNSLSCFSDIQAHFDPFAVGDKENEPVKLNIF